MKQGVVYSRGWGWGDPVYSRGWGGVRKLRKLIPDNSLFLSKEGCKFLLGVNKCINVRS